MQSSLNLPSYEQKNTSDNNKNKVTMQSEYDMQMIKKYLSEIKNGTLIIDWNPDLKSLDFIKLLNLNALVLKYCEQQIPQLESLTIKELEITECYIYSIQGFQLNNLEVLKLCNTQYKLESNTLVQEILNFKKLKELSLQKCITDFSPLSLMITLTKLSLIKCELRSTEALRPLIKLEELYLSYYMYIDINALQYLTDLTILKMESCNLVNIDALRPLKKLKELSIFYNQIVYLQPLIELKQLQKLNARSNKIIDFQAIQLHPNFNNFILYGQKQPTQKELQTANIMKDINNQISSLKQLYQQSSRIKNQNILFRQKISQQLQDSYNNHERFLTRVDLLFQKMNVFEDCQ
ncbi:NEAT_domain-containing leucine-rich repeat protein [Hexamita inflata]|uniref:NEAT_domain-containing leucine-rich repeat protein n=1 Tax=Hexamita inflata TaxID=28002 RepID=A0ABP1IAJ9_9EUKA